MEENNFRKEEEKNLYTPEEESKEAEFSEVPEMIEEEYVPTPEEIARKKKRDAMIEMVLIFVLGILIGVAVKTEAMKRITIGYDDYKMKTEAQDYNINQLQADAVKKQEEAAKAQENAAPGGAPSDQNSPASPTDNSQPAQ